MSRGLKIISLLLGVWLVAGCASSAERKDERDKNLRMVETHVQLGVQYLQRGQLELATENIEKALSLDADNSQANHIMALLQWRLKKDDEAERYFRKAVNTRPENPEAQNNYGVFLCSHSRIDEAEQWFKKAIANQLYRTPDEANLNAGVCLMKKPAPAAAEKYFREALQINPRLSPALYQMVRISLDSGQILSARGFMERYFQSGPDTPESLLLAVRIEHALGNKNAEASYGLRLKSKFPDSAEATQLPKYSQGSRKTK
ncbi:MAG: type IV pilus biogenesis/stability protein PilW [Pseudomonadota bacterium]